MGAGSLDALAPGSHAGTTRLSRLNLVRVSVIVYNPQAFGNASRQTTHHWDDRGSLFPDCSQGAIEIR